MNSNHNLYETTPIISKTETVRRKIPFHGTALLSLSSATHKIRFQKERAERFLKRSALLILPERLHLPESIAITYQLLSR